MNARFNIDLNETESNIQWRNCSSHQPDLFSSSFSYKVVVRIERKRNEGNLCARECFVRHLQKMQTRVPTSLVLLCHRKTERYTEYVVLYYAWLRRYNFRNNKWGPVRPGRGRMKDVTTTTSRVPKKSPRTDPWNNESKWPRTTPMKFACWPVNINQRTIEAKLAQAIR